MGVTAHSGMCDPCTSKRRREDSCGLDSSTGIWKPGRSPRAGCRHTGAWPSGAWWSEGGLSGWLKVSKKLLKLQKTLYLCLHMGICLERKSLTFRRFPVLHTWKFQELSDSRRKVLPQPPVCTPQALCCPHPAVQSELNGLLLTSTTCIKGFGHGSGTLVAEKSASLFQ